MDKKHDENLNYFLVKFSILMGVLTIFLSAYMAFSSYQRTVKVRLDGYDRMLKTLDASYLLKLVSENERELDVLVNSLDESAIKQGASAINSLWPIAHRIKMEENHFIYFYGIAENRIDSYPAWTPGYGFDATERPWHKILDGSTDDSQWIGPYPEFGSGELVLTLGKKIVDSSGGVLGLLLVDMPLDKINQTLKHALGDLDTSLFLQNIKTGEMLSIVNSDLYKPEYIDGYNKDIAFSGLKNGATITHPLEYVEWQLGMYIPQKRFVAALQTELSKVLLPICIVALIVWLGVFSLIRVVRQEQKVLLERLRRIDEDSYVLQHHDAMNISWFIGKSLSEIDKIKKRYNQNRQELRLDPLTGILNRRAFEQDVESLRNESLPHSLLLIDLDKFKSINDNLGHQVGDLVLCRVADSLVSTLGLERVYRIGGDEFAALLPMGKDNVTPQVELLMHHVRHLKWREHDCTVTLSIGIASGPGDPAKIFSDADSALYRSKRNGRDCWSFA
ncbi:sensor domain-containing diguanylate cyclase [Aeromonas hydrophila]|uniref:sensor domain-containing diguanylate cyclase n=1 Tax=Aeromonas hydrophila TaxID=644 RepID=UPI000A853AAB|nr:sensor domain-containing diguanylate cyclase [Aeromonas hydrophila]